MCLCCLGPCAVPSSMLAITTRPLSLLQWKVDKAVALFSVIFTSVKDPPTQGVGTSVPKANTLVLYLIYICLSCGTCWVRLSLLQGELWGARGQVHPQWAKKQTTMMKRPNKTFLCPVGPEQQLRTLCTGLRCLKLLRPMLGVWYCTTWIHLQKANNQ